MSKQQEAMRLALEALESTSPLGYNMESDKKFFAAITALRAALAEPVQEPVAWRYKKEGGGWFVSDNEPQYVEQWNDIEEIQPLYTAPPQRKPLLAVDLRALYDQHAACQEEGPETSGWWDFARAIERAHEIT